MPAVTFSHNEGRQIRKTYHEEKVGHGPVQKQWQSRPGPIREVIMTRASINASSACQTNKLSLTLHSGLHLQQLSHRVVVPCSGIHLHCMLQRCCWSLRFHADCACHRYVQQALCNISWQDSAMPKLRLLSRSGFSFTWEVHGLRWAVVDVAAAQVIPYNVCICQKNTDSCRKMSDSYQIDPFTACNIPQFCMTDIDVGRFLEYK